jgi:hypothetical protein
VHGELLAAQDGNSDVLLFDASSPSSLPQCGKGGPPGCLWFDLNAADGSLGAGLWLPLDDYGVVSVPIVR